MNTRVLGGVRSGKSRHAADIAAKHAVRPDALILIDCLTLWPTNLLCSDDGGAHAREVDALLRALPTLHQQLASFCDRVVLLVAGIPTLLKDQPRA